MTRRNVSTPLRMTVNHHCLGKDCLQQRKIQAISRSLLNRHKNKLPSYRKISIGSLIFPKKITARTLIIHSLLAHPTSLIIIFAQASPPPIILLLHYIVFPINNHNSSTRNLYKMDCEQRNLNYYRILSKNVKLRNKKEENSRRREKLAHSKNCSKTSILKSRLFPVDHRINRK